MIFIQMWLPLFIIINICKSHGSTTNPENISNNVNQILEHILPKTSSSDHQQIFQGTIILNINYPESKSAVNIYNSPNRKNNLCNCNNNNMSSNNNNQPECNCSSEKQNFSNFLEDTKDLKNNTNKDKLEHNDLQNDEDIINNTSTANRAKFTDKPLISKINLTKDQQDFQDLNITLKGNHQNGNNNTLIKINKSDSLNNLSQFSVANKVATNLLSMAINKINTIPIKVSKKLDRLRNLNKTNSTVGFLIQKTEKKLPSKLSVNLFENNTSDRSVLTKEAIIQESIVNFQQYIPPLLNNNSFVKNISESEEEEEETNTLCQFPAKCVYLMYCTVDGKISNGLVILNAEEEKLRNKLPDCADELTGRTGKCCIDKISGD